MDNLHDVATRRQRIPHRPPSTVAGRHIARRYAVPSHIADLLAAFAGFGQEEAR